MKVWLLDISTLCKELLPLLEKSTKNVGTDAVKNLYESRSSTKHYKKETCAWASRDPSYSQVRMLLLMEKLHERCYRQTISQFKSQESFLFIYYFCLLASGDSGALALRCCPAESSVILSKDRTGLM